MMRVLVTAFCFGLVLMASPSLYALQEEEATTEESAESQNEKADKKPATAEKVESTKKDSAKKKTEEEAKKAAKENAEKAQGELEAQEAAASANAPALVVPAPKVEAEAPVVTEEPALAPKEDTKKEAAPAAPMAEVKVAPQGDSAAEDTVAKEDKAAWAGSSVSYSINTDLASLIPALNNDWNETVKSSLKFAPSWVFNKQYSLSGRLAFTCEFTQPGSADGGYNNRRCSMSNTTVNLSLGELYVIPEVDVSIRAKVAVTLPTDIYTIESGGLFGLSAGASASRTFDDLGGLSVTYSFGLSHDVRNRFLGGQTADEHAGDRVVPNRITPVPMPDYVPQQFDYATPIVLGISNSASANYSVTDWASISASFGFENALLQEASGVELDGQLDRGVSENIVQLTGNDSQWRAFLTYSLVASFSIPKIPYLGISTGLAWYQKAPDRGTGSYLSPFRPKDTSIFLNFSVNSGKLMDELL